MNITFVTPQLKIGGYEKVVVNYANAFNKLGYRVTIVCGFKVGECSTLLDPEITVVEFKARLRNFLFPLVKFLKDNNVDILYVPFHTYTSVAVIAKKLAKVNTVIYSAQHGFQRGNKIKIHFFSKFVRRADVLIAVSKDVADFEANQLNIERDRYYIFDNPVFNSADKPMVIQNKWIQGKSCPILVTSGRLAEDKHIEIPIKILSEVIKEKEVCLLILGEGDRKKYLQNLCRELKISDKVRFEGFVNNPISYFKLCDIYLQTSEIESFGNGVIEAQYCELPCIVTDCGGPIKLIEHNKYGVNIGKYNDKNIIKNGKEAVLKILNKEIEFENMKEQSLRYDAMHLEKQFMEPYYEYIKKN